MENKKYVLFEKSLKSPEMSEEDKLNMAFFKTLLPALRNIDQWTFCFVGWNYRNLGSFSHMLTKESTGSCWVIQNLKAENVG